MNDKLKEQLAQIAGADQTAESWRAQGVGWASFFQGAKDAGLDDVWALHLTKNCYERLIHVLLERGAQ